MLKRSWAEIDLERLANNYKIYEKQISAGQEIMAVVKADAYGHGDKEVVKKLLELGCNNFAVSNILEGIIAREAGAKGQVLILGYTPAPCIPDLIKYDITQALLSEEYAESFASFFTEETCSLSPKDLKTQFAIDSGMNRIGLDADDPEGCDAAIRKYAAVFNMTGIFTHLCAADTPAETEFTKGQIAKFKAVAGQVSDLNLSYVHCMNTAGGLYCEPYGNLVRLGIALYGLKPDYDNVLPEGIKPVLTWKSVISMIKTVHSGETVGYGRTYKAEREMRVATIPTGYADGYNRMLSNKGVVLIKGKKAPIIGRVCMDQLMIDVTDIPDVKYEDEVVLLGEGYNADDMAKTIGTIGYEIVCAISKRIPRNYV